MATAGETSAQENDTVYLPLVSTQNTVSEQDKPATEKDLLSLTHPNQGYTISYPAKPQVAAAENSEEFHVITAFDIADADNDVVTIASTLSTGDPGEKISSEEIRINIGRYFKTKAADESLNNWYNRHLQELQSLGLSVVQPTSMTPTTVGGLDALQIISIDDSRNHELILISHGNQVYFLQKWPAVSIYDSMFSEMVDSFTIGQDTTNGSEMAESQVRVVDQAPVKAAQVGGYLLPFDGTHPITSGPRCQCSHYNDPANCAQFWRSEEAIDFGMPTYTSIYASQTGNVFYRGYNDQGFGILAIIEDAGGQRAYYAHLQAFSMSMPNTGNTVNQSTIIGYSGQTGMATGPHLHYEVRNSNNNNSPVVITGLPGLNWDAGMCSGQATGDH